MVRSLRLFIFPILHSFGMRCATLGKQAIMKAGVL